MPDRNARSALYARSQNWLIGSDPGLLRLRMATRTTAALAAALVILDLLMTVAGQPMSVALLGVVIAMISARAANEPDRRRQAVTMALLPVAAALAITAGVLLAPHRVAEDVVFVAIMVVAVYIRRFGGRGMALGMVAFMTYFFGVFLRAKLDELPWLILAIVIGTLCSFLINSYLLPDRPERVLPRAQQALWARMAAVVDTTGEAVLTGRLDQRRRRRLWVRASRLNETALMVQSLLEDDAGPVAEDLAIRFFDAELAVERLVAAGQAASGAVEMPAETRVALAAALGRLAAALRVPRPAELRRAAELAGQLTDRQPGGPGSEVQHLALAITALATAASEARSVTNHTGAAPSAEPAGARTPPASPGGAAGGQGRGLRPTTRQAIQVGIAASLAIIAGELASPARWYWAVIAAFMVFTGTTSWGETLTKGWQRLLGTLLGVPAGMLVATLVSGHTAVSIGLIFVCLFCNFYLMQVAYSLMIFFITTLLALLYGLLGQFSVHVLLLRIEETAIGAVIGAAVAVLVLPTDTRTSVADAARSFLNTLSEVIATSAETMFGEPGHGAGAATGAATEKARQLGRDLQQFRITAKPLTAGVAGRIVGRGSIRHAVVVLTACDHHARVLARCSARYDDETATLAGVVASSAVRTRDNIDALVAALDRRTAAVRAATELLDTADTLVMRDGGDPAVRPDTRRMLLALRSLRHIDRAIVDAAIDMGATDAEFAVEHRR